MIECKFTLHIMEHYRFSIYRKLIKKFGKWSFIKFEFNTLISPVEKEKTGFKMALTAFSYLLV